MTLNERVESLVRLGESLRRRDDTYAKVCSLARSYNGWFTQENIDSAIHNICANYLDKSKLEGWITNYDWQDIQSPKKIALITAGNIPLVGMHDLISVFISGNAVVLKPSSKDKTLTEYVIALWNEIDPKVPIQIVDKLEDYDAVITTSTNSNATTFEYYFRHVPHIIRRNRNSIAIFHGDETAEDFQALSHDIFDYFGLGCRNVSSILFPEHYDMTPLMESLDANASLANHNKYKNNFDYNNAIFILNKETFLANNCFLLRKSDSLASRIATVHYQNYIDLSAVKNVIDLNKDKLQCVISKHSIEGVDVIPMGRSQAPQLWDYADGVDTLDFLLKLSS